MKKICIRCGKEFDDINADKFKFPVHRQWCNECIDALWDELPKESKESKEPEELKEL